MRTLLFILFSLTSTLAMADSACRELSDALSCDKYSTNFDGSVFIETPKVQATGSFIPLAWFPNTPAGIGYCKLLNKTFVNFQGTIPGRRVKYAASLREDGTLDSNGVVEYPDAIVEWVLCR